LCRKAWRKSFGVNAIVVDHVILLYPLQPLLITGVQFFSGQALGEEVEFEQEEVPENTVQALAVKFLYEAVNGSKINLQLTMHLKPIYNYIIILLFNI